MTDRTPTITPQWQERFDQLRKEFDSATDTDEPCQCPKCGRMHRRLGTPPRSISGPTEAEIEVAKTRIRAVFSYGGWIDDWIDRVARAALGVEG